MAGPAVPGLPAERYADHVATVRLGAQRQGTLEQRPGPMEPAMVRSNSGFSMKIGAAPGLPSAQRIWHASRPCHLRKLTSSS